MRKAMRFTFLLVLTLLACTGHRYPTKLVVADSMCAINPDSALGILKLMEDTMSSAGKADRMYYELLKADAMNKAYVDMTTDSILKEVVDYYDRHGSANERMRAHYLLGCAYRDMGEAPMALQCYQDAVDKADTTETDCMALLYKVHGQMSDLYYEEYLPKESLSEIMKAEYYARKAKDTLFMLVSFEKRANIYNMIEKPDSAVEVLRESIRKYQEYGLNDKRVICTGVMIQSLAEAGRFGEMPDYMGIYEESPMFDSAGNIKKGYELYYYAKGMYHLNTSSPDSSDYLFHRLLNESSNENDSLAACDGLRKLYTKNGLRDSVLKYSESCISLINKSFDKSTARNMQHISALYNYDRQERLAKKKEMEASRYRLFTIVTSALLVVGLLFVWFYHERSQRKMNWIRNEYNKARLSLLQNNNDTQTISSLQQRIQRMESSHPFLIDDRLKESSVYSKFLIIAKGNSNVCTSLEDFKDLRQLMDEVYPRFHSFLLSKHASLSISDYELCILTRMHFTNSEICNIISKPSGYVSVNQKRLLGKIFGVKGSPRDLEYHLMRIS